MPSFTSFPKFLSDLGFIFLYFSKKIFFGNFEKFSFFFSKKSENFENFSDLLVGHVTTSGGLGRVRDRYLAFLSGLGSILLYFLKKIRFLKF